jgi:transposase
MSMLLSSVNHMSPSVENSAGTAVRSEGERSEPERITAVPAAGETPDPEVVGRAVRRRFSAAYKQRVLAETDVAATGEIGRILRREGLYSSHLAKWRQARADSQLAALAPVKRGPKPSAVNPLQAENAQLKREMARLQKKLRTAELMIDLQKKVSQILGITLPMPDESDDDEVSS